ncbi:hypothetical protein [Vulcanococcus sp.]|uniref:hypothetical protein n=1 Tax=Vulcanococcus sp. TaxID=2856995 RepID=UPI003C0AA00C
MTTATFQIGSTYAMRWVGDADAITPCKVLKRTAKFATFELPGFGVKRAGVKVCPLTGSEYAMPTGSYSMAPCVKAERLM